MTDTIRVWTRKEIEDAAAIEPEGRTMLRVAMSPKFLLMLIDSHDRATGERTEILSAYGNPEACELRWFKRDQA